MKELLLQTLVASYAIVGVIGLIAYWPTIKDLHRHKKASANTTSFLLWTTANGITVLYSIFILPDLLFRLISGMHFLACLTILILIIKLNNTTKH